MNKLEFSKKIWELGERTARAGEEYAEIPKKHKLRTEEDVENLKKEWLKKVEDFREIQREMKKIFFDYGIEEEAKEVYDSFKKYVGYIEEKTKKFSVSAMNSGELDRINKLEIKESQRFKALMKKLTKELYS